MTCSVEIEDVAFAYRRHRVLTGASWSVGRGVTALLGPNGAGKTTLIRCVVGLAVPRRGRISVGGRDIRDGKEPMGLIGYVPQKPELPSLVRVGDIVAYAAWLSGLHRTAVDAAVESALTKMQVADLASRRVRTLSGGQRQRVALATGIVHAPEVLILDEPTAGLDPGQRLKVREVIRSIGEDRPVVLSTHMTEDVEHLADSVGVLAGGRIQYHGPLSELSTQAPEVPAGDRPLGSSFERAYDSLMASFGTTE